jgi:hypothetical protein
MSNDLIARLRDWSDGPDTDDLCREAADALTAQENALGFLRQISEQQAYEINQQAATIAEQAREIEALRADATAALNLWPRDCRLCANFTTATGGCTSTVQCVDSDQYRATRPRQYWKVVTP